MALAFLVIVMSLPWFCLVLALALALLCLKFIVPASLVIGIFIPMVVLVLALALSCLKIHCPCASCICYLYDHGLVWALALSCLQSIALASLVIVMVVAIALTS